MRHVIISLSLIGSLVIFLLNIDFFDTVILFLLFGIVPGHQEPLSATLMLSVYVISGVVITLYALRRRLNHHLKQLWQAALHARSETA